jgi:hypothetical protein
MKTNTAILVILLSVGVLLNSCQEDPKFDYRMRILEPKSDTRQTYYLGDTITVKFVIESSDLIKVVDVNFIDQSSQESVYFETFYPKKNNSLITTTYPIPTSFPDPNMTEMYIYMGVDLSSSIRGSNFSGPGEPAYFKILSK